MNYCTVKIVRAPIRRLICVSTLRFCICLFRTNMFWFQYENVSNDAFVFDLLQCSVAMNKVFRTFRIIYSAWSAWLVFWFVYFAKMTPRQGCAFIGNFASIQLVLLVGHAFNLNINVLIAIEIRVFLSFHCPKVEVTTCIKCGCKTVPAVFSSIENFDKEVCQALDSSELNRVSKRRERLSQHCGIMTYKQRTFKTGLL